MIGQENVASFEPLWKVDDLARYLQCSVSSVYQRSAEGKIPCLRIGGTLRFEPEEIRRWARGELPAPGKLLALSSCK